MNGWLDLNADGLVLMLVFGLAGTAFLAVALVIEWLVTRRRAERWALTRIDYARCERAGSQDSFRRRLRARGAA